MNKIIPYNPKLKKFARILRRNSTLCEVLLWLEIKNKSLGYEFHRQVPIDKYIVDFICFEKRLTVEVDGAQHADQDNNDKERDMYLQQRGFKILRFWNNEVLQDIEAVKEVILRHLVV